MSGNNLKKLYYTIQFVVIKSKQSSVANLDNVLYHDKQVDTQLTKLSILHKKLYFYLRYEKGSIMWVDMKRPVLPGKSEAPSNPLRNTEWYKFSRCGETPSIPGTP